MGDALVHGVRSGDARSVARALTVVENDPEMREELERRDRFIGLIGQLMVQT